MEEGSDDVKQIDKDRVGVCVGMGMVDLEDIQNTGTILEEKGYSRVSPYFIPRILPNLAAGQISIRYGLRVCFHSLNYLFQTDTIIKIVKLICSLFASLRDPTIVHLLLVQRAPML